VAIDRLFTLAGNGTIDSSGTYGNNVVGTATANNAALVFSNTGAVALAGATGAKTLTLQGNSTGDNQINLQLADASGPRTLAITKAGGGLWVLGNTNNTYSGATSILQGILRAQDANSTAVSATTLEAATGTTDLWVNSSNGLVVGQSVTGTGVAGGTTIAAILDPTHIRLSQSATVAIGASLSFGSINSLSGSSNLIFTQPTGGTEAVLGSAGLFTRAIGTGAGQVQWGVNQSGGFAASSSPLVVNFGGANAQVSFGTGGLGNGTGLVVLELDDGVVGRDGE